MNTEHMETIRKALLAERAVICADPDYAPDERAEHLAPIDAALVAVRLEYLRGQLRAECISYGELAELQSLAEFIEPGDVELLEPAGVPEFPEDSSTDPLDAATEPTGDDWQADPKRAQAMDDAAQDALDAATGQGRR